MATQVATAQRKQKQSHNIGKILRGDTLRIVTYRGETFYLSLHYPGRNHSSYIKMKVGQNREHHLVSIDGRTPAKIEIVGDVIEEDKTLTIMIDGWVEHHVVKEATLLPAEKKRRR